MDHSTGNEVQCNHEASTDPIWPKKYCHFNTPYPPIPPIPQPEDDCCDCCYVGHSGTSCAGKLCRDPSTGNEVVCNHEAHTDPFWAKQSCGRNPQPPEPIPQPLLDCCCDCCYIGHSGPSCAGEFCLDPSTGNE